MIDTTSIKIYAISTFGGPGRKAPTLENFRDFDPEFVKGCLRAAISRQNIPAYIQASAQKALEELQ
jgi:hypothetical protein